ncbi:MULTISPECIES: alcohol dehydrogenase catalytic domain-containing protein [Thermomonospora]|uniref:S-(Hydroxymethyl)glutathione dehydrogenase/alcohol dehydrogenase n=1 Tax=Thermomonospora cellulosilytica TaxID=1411118 RepID=A0A7W3N4I7_9ACTN|nr:MULTISPECIES: alcohol dehydrogenase catalytic domain-containing protein [Thermomonospora]MBA9007418.1 S-(hydroxymethyl)glutathione dehydrogenase/alcohol dehydrogenase [Thermomonospora cellulosilytica]
MRAAILHAAGDTEMDLRDDVTLNPPEAGEVRVRIRATGICHSDLSAMSGVLPTTLPAVLGHEAAGEVVEVGPGVTAPAVGDHVIISFTPACRRCPECLAGQPYLCMSGIADAFGKAPFRHGGTDVYRMAGCGSWAEETVVPAAAAVPVDPDVPFDLAAMMSCGVTTGAGAALNTARIRPGDSVVVIGAGGVGLSVIQGARLAGAAVIVAVDPLEAKHETALRFGATHATAPDGLAELQNALTAGRGFDHAFEAVGRSATMRAAWDAARRGGDVILVGAGAADDTWQVDMFSLLFLGKNVLSSLYGTSDVERDARRWTDLWRAGRLDLAGLITRRIPFEELNDGIAALRKGEVIRQVVLFD